MAHAVPAWRRCERACPVSPAPSCCAPSSICSCATAVALGYEDSQRPAARLPVLQAERVMDAVQRARSGGPVYYAWPQEAGAELGASNSGTEQSAAAGAAAAPQQAQQQRGEYLDAPAFEAVAQDALFRSASLKQARAPTGRGRGWGAFTMRVNSLRPPSVHAPPALPWHWILNYRVCSTPVVHPRCSRMHPRSTAKCQGCGVYVPGVGCAH